MFSQHGLRKQWHLCHDWCRSHAVQFQADERGLRAIHQQLGGNLGSLSTVAGCSWLITLVGKSPD